MKKLLIVDGSNLLFQMFYGMPARILGPAGQPIQGTLGFVGALLIMALFAVTIMRGYWIALRAADRFSTVFAAGLVTLVAVQTVLNLGVVTNLLPSTGIALPFFSYGGTALAVNLGEMGIVLSISRQRNQAKRQEV